MGKNVIPKVNRKSKLKCVCIMYETSIPLCFRTPSPNGTTRRLYINIFLVRNVKKDFYYAMFRGVWGLFLLRLQLCLRGGHLRPRWPNVGTILRRKEAKVGAILHLFISAVLNWPPSSCQVLVKFYQVLVKFYQIAFKPPSFRGRAAVTRRQASSIESGHPTGDV